MYDEHDYGVGSAFFSNTGWFGRLLSHIDIGRVLATRTPYDLTFSSFEIEGQVPSEEWYFTEGYSGYGVDPLDSDVLWQGTNDTSDSSSYTELTGIRNLMRYSYIRPISPRGTGEMGLTLRN